MYTCSTIDAVITVGIDEVGRGCWAGPLVAGAVILTEPITGLRDSKKLSKLQREKLREVYSKLPEIQWSYAEGMFDDKNRLVKWIKKAGATNRIMSSPSFMGNLKCSRYDFNITRWALI